MTEDAKLPRAVASTEAVPDRRSRHIAIVVAVLAAAGLFTAYLVRPLPGFALSMFGGAGDGIPRHGGLRLVWRPPPGIDLEALRDRFSRHDARARMHIESGDVVVEVAGVTPDEAAEVATAIGVGGGLEFREVIESTAAADLEKMGLAFDSRHSYGDVREPRFEVDQWRPETGDGVHTDFFLSAHSRELLDETFDEATRRGWRPPPHTVVAYERVVPWGDARDQRPYYRTYFVVDHTDIDGDTVANAVGSYDPNTNRPIVLLDFDAEGARQFGEVTQRIVGHKLATLLGGEVRSAPIINGAIRGGRASITMGGNSAARMERERDTLVKTLRAGALPVGGTVLEQRYVPPEDHAIAAVLARLVIALVGGGVAGALAWLVLRFARSERREVPAVTGTGVASPRLVWNILGIAILLIGTQITLPGVNEVELAHVVTKTASGWRDLTQMSVFALGLTPVITSFVIVEVVAAIVPRWRRLRDRPEGRRKIAYVVAVLAIVVTVVQAYFVASFLEALSRGGAEVFEGGTAARWLAVATMVGGTMLLVWVASLIGDRGIGNGYAVLFTAQWTASVQWDYVVRAPVLALLFAAIAIGAVVAIAIAMLRWRIRGLRRPALPLPISGIAPIAEAGGMSILIFQLVNLDVISPRNRIVQWMESVDHRLVFALVALVGWAALWAFVFARPGRRRAELARAGLEPVDRGMWLRAFGLGTAMLAAVFALDHVTRQIDLVFAFVETTGLVLVIATIMDVVGELRDRRRGLIPVWPLHDPLLVDVVRDRLTAAEIPHHMQAAHYRSLLWLLGPHVPVMVLVPAEHAASAEANIRELFG